MKTRLYSGYRQWTATIKRERMKKHTFVVLCCANHLSILKQISFSTSWPSLVTCNCTITFSGNTQCVQSNGQWLCSCVIDHRAERQDQKLQWSKWTHWTSTCTNSKMTQVLRSCIFVRQPSTRNLNVHFENFDPVPGSLSCLDLCTNQQQRAIIRCCFALMEIKPIPTSTRTWNRSPGDHVPNCRRSHTVGCREQLILHVSGIMEQRHQINSEQTRFLISHFNHWKIHNKPARGLKQCSKSRSLAENRNKKLDLSTPRHSVHVLCRHVLLYH